MFTSKNFTEYSAVKLAEMSHNTTKAALGDRSTYIGASDIGDCLRKSYCSKMYPAPELTLEKLLVFGRGHIAERIVENILDGLDYVKQYEAEGLLDGFPIKAHCDFLVKAEDELIYIECKTVSAPIDEPYSSWFYQCQFGMGLIKANNPGMKVRAMIIAIDLNLGWMKPFDIEFSGMNFEVALGKAGILINAIRTGIEPEAEQQFYCSKCLFKEECPGLQCGNKAELPEDVKRAVIRLREYNSLKKEMDATKDMIKDFMTVAGIRTGLAGDITVQYRSKKGSVTIDKDVLSDFLQENHPEMSLDVFSKTGEASNYIQIV